MRCDHARCRQRGDFAEGMAQHHVRLDAVFGEMAQVAKRNADQQGLEMLRANQFPLRSAQADPLQVGAHALARMAHQVAECRVHLEQIGRHADILRTLAGEEEDVHASRIV